MVETLSEIRERFDYYKGDYYVLLRGEQQTDDDYYNDIFGVDTVQELVTLSRTGGGAELIEDPVAQISSVQMKVSRPVRKDTAIEKEANERITTMLNEIWIPLIQRRSPNPIFMFNKNQFLRGEAWLQILHNEKWVVRNTSGYLEREGLPVVFLVREPMTIYASPNENEEGIPEHVYIYYQRLPTMVKAMYPSWTNPKARNPLAKEKGKKFVDWVEYWSKDKWLCEADGETVKDQPNIYGVPPFIHKVSGWGTDSPSGAPEDKAVGRLRKYRDLLKRECAITSDVDSQYHLYANKNIWVQPADDLHKIPENFRENFRMQAGFVNELPPGLNFGFLETDVPDREALNYLLTIKGELGRKMPGAMSGDLFGGSGRQQDIGYSIATKKFEQQIQNTRYAFESAFQMALSYLEKIPKLMPDKIHEDDIKGDYRITLELKGDDPLENERLSTRGSRQWQAGEIDLETNLTRFQGFSSEEARRIKKDIMVERIMFSPTSPFAQIIAMWLAQELGMEEQLKAMQMMGTPPASMEEATSPTKMKRGQGEVETPMGREMIDQSLQQVGARRRPVAY